MTEPQASDPARPRYTATPFPPYRFVPGRYPHPRRNPLGHSYGRPEPQLEPFSPEAWPQAEGYLYGIDLYNYAYWWECHEVFESFWHAVGHKTEQGNFFQALIQLAAANLKHVVGDIQAADNLTRRGLVRLDTVPDFYMGVDVRGLSEEIRRHGIGPAKRPVLIRLTNPINPLE
ncbi:MAG: DUF309 domain-containing protein [Nitrospirota bacterium]|nr:DUF309 domain-containing protein [Nitrospirota bacterium]